MTETIETLLQPIQNRLNAATPGPWSHGRGITPYVAKRDWVEVQNQATICHDVRPADADFIANAPTDQARLLAAVQAVTELHRPERGTVHDPDDGETKEMDYCETCSDSQWLDEATAVAYPCPTVTAIESALSEAR